MSNLISISQDILSAKIKEIEKLQAENDELKMALTTIRNLTRTKDKASEELKLMIRVRAQQALDCCAGKSK